MFDHLAQRLQGVLKKLAGEARISEAVLDATLREVRLVLLEADVHVAVVKQLLAAVREKALGQEVLQSLSPGQQTIKIVRDELARVLGAGEPSDLRFASRPPSVFLLVGLQGSGKTTTTAKLGAWLRQAGHFPYLVPADVQRPAAIEQLVRVGGQAGLKVHAHDGSRPALDVSRDALRHARQSGFDALLVDTAGRLHVDAALMDELGRLKEALEPVEILFVADSMTGQDAVRSAGEFHTKLGLSGVVLTKLDGDARGGAALSIRHVTGVPIKFVGTGERTEEFERFHAERLAGRILGMGDILGLIERAEQVVDVQTAEVLQRKLRRNEFTLGDFAAQLRTLQRMGPLSGIVGMLPGMSHVKEADLDKKALVRVLAIVDSMTPRERQLPQILDARRKRRIARGSGQSVPEINRLLKQFAEIKRMMKSVQALSRGGRRPGGVPGMRGRLPFWGRRA